MVMHLSTKEELDYLAKTFKAFDIDGNGCISKEEMFHGYKRLYGEKMSEEQIAHELDVLWA
jgi:calcium-dependent protein kinase